MTVYVLVEEDPEFGSTEIIGVVSHAGHIILLMGDYYGDFKLVRSVDVRDSGVETIYSIEYFDREKWLPVTVTVFSFLVDDFQTEYVEKHPLPEK